MPVTRHVRRWATVACLVALVTAWPGTTPGYVYQPNTGELVMDDAALCCAAPAPRPLERVPVIVSLPEQPVVARAVRFEHQSTPARPPRRRALAAVGSRGPPLR